MGGNRCPVKRLMHGEFGGSDLESSRASSRQSMAIGDEDPRIADLASFSRDPSRAPSTIKVGPAEAALQLDNEAIAIPEMLHAPPAAPSHTAVAPAVTEDHEAAAQDETHSARPVTGGGSRATSVAARTSPGETPAGRDVVDAEDSVVGMEQDSMLQEAPVSSLPITDQSAEELASQTQSDWGPDAETAAVRIQAVAREGMTGHKSANTWKGRWPSTWPRMLTPSHKRALRTRSGMKLLRKTPELVMPRSVMSSCGRPRPHRAQRRDPLPPAFADLVVAARRVAASTRPRPVALARLP